MSTQYVSSVGWTAVTPWAASTVIAAGSIRRQLASAVGVERCFRTANGGTTGGTEPVWVTTAGGVSPTDGTITDWTEITGQQAYQVSGGAWNAPHMRLTNAVATGWLAAGDDCYVRDDHAETRGTNVTITFPGTFGSPNRCICVVADCTIPPASGDERTTATASTTGASGLGVTGAVYLYGLTFSAGSGASQGSVTVVNAAPAGVVADACTFKLNNTSTASVIALFNVSAVTQARTTLRDCVFNFGAVAQGFALGQGYTDIIGGSLTGAALTNLFKTPLNNWGITTFRGFDFSNMGSGKTLVPALTRSHTIIFDRCKFGASPTITAAQTIAEVTVDVFNSDSGATNYRNEHHNTFGDLTTETTVVMTGGASDGVTPFSHKIVTTANANYTYPFDSFPMGEFFADTAGVSISQTFELLTDGVTLTNKDAWIELEYISSSSAPLGALLSNMAAPLDAGTNLTTSTATWTTTGIASPVKQKIVAGFTPQMKGLFRATLKVAKPSTTLYLSPPASAAA